MYVQLKVSFRYLEINLKFFLNRFFQGVNKYQVHKKTLQNLE